MPSFSDSSSEQASILDFADVDLCSKANVTKVSNGQEDKQVRLRLSLDEICHRTNFTRKEVRAFYRTLKQECPLGVVTEETLRDAYHRLFPNGNVGMYVKYVFRTLDTQGNGKITFTQLLVFLSTISKGTHLDRLKWIFRLYDLDGDGAIQHSELLNLCCAIHELAGTTEKRIFHESKKSGKEEMFSESEKDRKFRQIKLWVDKVFRRWDSNQDGQVTLEEFLASYSNDDLLETSLHYFDDL
ncbi:hippocalcin-like protein 1 [Daphnia pulex]|uniref:hippocalcin-like protein 1 n=1 Tax=Daphnia pulex TaxID=6669 RepID=UPI001EE07BD6|nr:hippocalcin-like protein 1 [Daphnia pulex]